MKEKRPCLLLLLTSLNLFLASCSYQTADKESPEVNTFRQGDHFRINLPEDHRDGYTWQLNDDFNRRVLDDKNPVWHGNEKGIDFNFNTLSAGQTTLTFVKRKYTDTLTVKSFIVKILPG